MCPNNLHHKHTGERGSHTNNEGTILVKQSIIINFNKVDFTITANNIFDADYIEAGFVPMPPSNVLFGIRYNF